MAKKIKKIITVNNQNGKTNKRLIVTLIVLSIVLIVSLGMTVLIVLNYNSKLDKIKQKNKEIKQVNKRLEDENEEIHNHLFSLIGVDSVDYVQDKLSFFDDNIVFVIEGFGNYYYSYDCMMDKVNGSFTYWAYNKEAAIVKGYHPGGC